MKIKIELDTDGTGITHDEAISMLKAVVEHAGSFIGDWPEQPIFHEGRKIGEWSYDSLYEMDEFMDLATDDNVDSNVTCEDCGIACNLRTGIDHEIVDGVKLCSDCALDVRCGHNEIYSSDEDNC